MLLLVRELPGCRGTVYTLQARSGFIVVRQGPPGDTGLRLRQTHIPIRSLSPAARRGLESGIAVPAASLERTLETLRQESARAAPDQP